MKRLIAITAFAAVLVSFVGVLPATAGGDPASEATGRFVDDDESAYEPEIEWLASEGITVGCNPPANDRFCPYDTVTRGQMASFLARAFDLPSTGRGAGLDDRVGWFVDDDDSVHEGNIEAIAGAGITIGCNPPANDMFCPNDTVTRGQMIAFLRRALDVQLYDVYDYYVDDDGIVFELDIEALVGYLSGTWGEHAGAALACDETLKRVCPYEVLTREVFAAWMWYLVGQPRS